jgi:Ribonuclease G/E
LRRQRSLRSLRKRRNNMGWKECPTCGGTGQVVDEQKICRIYGSEIPFEKKVPEENIREVCQDIYDHADHYSVYKRNSDAAYYRFLKFLWVEFPDGTEQRLTDIVFE